MPDIGKDRLMTHAAAAYEAQFGTAPAAIAWAPGRVNLLGEHTDYNGGYVLPMPLLRGTAVAIGLGSVPGLVTLASSDFSDVIHRGVGDPPSGTWSDYFFASLIEGGRAVAAKTGLNAWAVSDLPVGAGVSSSAALEVATLRACMNQTGTMADPLDIAIRARRIETDYIGVPCGIMDQFASSVGTPGTPLFLDTRTLAHQPVLLPKGHRIIVIQSGIHHRLADSGYATRVAECAAACKVLGVKVLSDLGPQDLPRLSTLDAPLGSRARHVVTENLRTQMGVTALAANDPARFGALMTQSHASARDDYQITLPETDAMVEMALAAGALGARQTGGGWGGCIVALAAEGRVAQVCATSVDSFRAARILAVI